MKAAQAMSNSSIRTAALFAIWDESGSTFQLAAQPVCCSRFSFRPKRTSDRPTKAWVEKVAQPIPEQVERADGEQDRKPRKEREPGLRTDEVPTLADHDAPLRRRRLRAEADEAEPGGGDDRRPHVEACLDQKRSERVREQMPREDPCPGRAHGARRLDELATA